MKLRYAAACVAISTQIEAAVKMCEEETSKLSQDYYTALAANSPGAAAKHPPSASTGPAPAKSKAGKDNPAAAAEVNDIMTAVTTYAQHRYVQYRLPGSIDCRVRQPNVSQACSELIASFALSRFCKDVQSSCYHHLSASLKHAFAGPYALQLCE